MRDTLGAVAAKLPVTMETPTDLPHRLLGLLCQEGLAAGDHLAAQWLADRLSVSRTPVNNTLRLLHAKGVLRREPNRGYFVADGIDLTDLSSWQKAGLDAPDVVSRAYFAIADDLLSGELPFEVTEAAVAGRYRLTKAQTNAVLGRIAQEGWVRKKPGYGWAFSGMLTTSNSLLQSYRLRLALEPAALREPGYRIAPEVLARCRAAEEHLMDGGIDADTPDQLHERGVRFHESLVEASGNPFFIDTVRRVNRVRRLISYRSMQDRKRYPEHCHQHLRILDLLAAGRMPEAADALAAHLACTLANHEKLLGLLAP